MKDNDEWAMMNGEQGASARTREIQLGLCDRSFFVVFRSLSARMRLVANASYLKIQKKSLLLASPQPTYPIVLCVCCRM